MLPRRCVWLLRLLLCGMRCPCGVLIVSTLTCVDVTRVFWCSLCSGSSCLWKRWSNVDNRPYRAAGPMWCTDGCIVPFASLTTRALAAVRFHGGVSHCCWEHAGPYHEGRPTFHIAPVRLAACVAAQSLLSRARPSLTVSVVPSVLNGRSLCLW